MLTLTNQPKSKDKDTRRELDKVRGAPGTFRGEWTTRKVPIRIPILEAAIEWSRQVGRIQLQECL